MLEYHINAAQGALLRRVRMNNETTTKAKVRKDIKNLGYHKVSIRTLRTADSDKVYSKIYVYGQDGECLVGDFNIYFLEKYEKARAALEYINKLPIYFDTGEIIKTQRRISLIYPRHQYQDK